MVLPPVQTRTWPATGETLENRKAMSGMVGMLPFHLREGDAAVELPE